MFQVQKELILEYFSGHEVGFEKNLVMFWISHMILNIQIIKNRFGKGREGWQG